MGQTGIPRDQQGQQKPWRALEQDSDQSGCFPVESPWQPWEEGIGRAEGGERRASKAVRRPLGQI